MRKMATRRAKGQGQVAQLMAVRDTVWCGHGLSSQFVTECSGQPGSGRRPKSRSVRRLPPLGSQIGYYITH
jgi:hypothetical protein